MMLTERGHMIDGKFVKLSHTEDLATFGKYSTAGLRLKGKNSFVMFNDPVFVKPLACDKCGSTPSNGKKEGDECATDVNNVKYTCKSNGKIVKLVYRLIPSTRANQPRRKVKMVMYYRGDQDNILEVSMNRTSTEPTPIPDSFVSGEGRDYNLSTNKSS